MSNRNYAVLSYTVYVLAVALAIFMTVAVWAIYFHNNPPAVVEPTGILDKEAYYPGERALLKATVLERNYRGVASLTVSWLCDGGRLRSDPPVDTRIVAGGNTFPVVVEIPITIRDDLPVGATCVRVATTTYKVNFLAPEREVSITSPPFMVLPPPGQ